MSNYLDIIRTKYDVKDYKEAQVEIPQLPADGIVLIVGTSGSGKSTILRSLGELKQPRVDDEAFVIDNFSTPERGEELLLSCGLRTIPAWFRPPATLSNGERHRFEMAVSLDQGINTIDEFTSVVDRDTAKSLAYSVRKYYDQQNNGKPLYIASCHRDIVEWLDPDYVYDTDLRVLENRRSLHRLGRRPPISLTIRSASNTYWRLFGKYHYLDTALARGAHCYVGFIDNKPVVFGAVIHSTSGTLHSYWRGHRTVVLPEFQGLGIGSAFSDAVAEIYHSRGLLYYSKTAHPAFGEHRNRSALWQATSTNGKSRANSYLNKDGSKRAMPGYGGTTVERDAARVCYSHKYIGKQ
jgi:ABC-type lipoprotein export system ATPase subunit/GNAT superfamily N-acetyltransferase